MSLIRHLPVIILFQVTITVCSQMGSLGISIAGGKGSSPCKDNDEVHFITQIYLVNMRKKLMSSSMKLLCFAVFFLRLASM